MKRSIYPIHTLDDLEFKIIQNIKLDNLLKFELKIDPILNCYEIKYLKCSSLITVREHMTNNAIDLLWLKRLITEMMKIKKNLSQYLLKEERLLFSTSHVFLDLKKETFLFSYSPFDVDENLFTELYFLRELYFESKVLHKRVNSIDLLRKNHFTLERLLEGLDGPSKKKSKFSFHRFNPMVSKNETMVYEPKSSYVLQACLIEKNQDYTRYPLRFENNTIGTGDHCNIVLNGHGIDYEHGLISVHNGQFYYTDLNSVTGSMVNDERINRSKKIINGDTLQIGFKEFIFIH